VIHRTCPLAVAVTVLLLTATLAPIVAAAPGVEPSPGLPPGVALPPFWASPARWSPSLRTGLGVPARLSPAQVPGSTVVTITMFADQFECAVRPGELVLFELEHADGANLAGGGIADETGVAIVTFGWSNVEPDAAVRPGDRITVLRQGQRPFVVDVPAFAADIDLAGTRVVGAAPAGSTVALSVVAGTDALTRTVTADGAGQFALDVRGGVDLSGDEVTGRAVLVGDGGARFIARFAAVTLDVALGGWALHGDGTPGTFIAATRVLTDGTALALGPTEILGDGGWWIHLDEETDTAVPLASGETITVRRHGGPLGNAPATVLDAVTLPEIGLLLQADRDRAIGVAAPGAPVEVTAAANPYGPPLPSRTVTVTAAATDGMFVADLPGIDLGPGWVVSARVHAAPRAIVTTRAVIPQALVGVDTNVLSGVADPGSDVGVVIRAPDATVRYSETVTVPDTGVFSSWLYDFAAVDAGEVVFAPGDGVEVAFVNGDPVLAPVPMLSARADEAADAVTGTAPASGAVTVVAGRGPSARSVDTAADVNGHYRADFAPGLDLVRPADGRVFMATGRAVAFYTTWSVIRLDVQMSDETVYVMANGPAGRAYEGRLVAPDGQVVGRTSGRAVDTTIWGDVFGPTGYGGTSGFLWLDFTDIASDPVPVRAGDRIELDAGEDGARLTVPRQQAAVFVEDDVIAGLSAPLARVRLEIASEIEGPYVVELTADATGAFAHDFGPDHDLAYNDSLRIIATIDGHLVTSYVTFPGLTLDLDTGTVAGTIAPDADLSVALRRGAATVAERSARADGSGVFETALPGAGGGPPDIRPGDRLVVRAGAPDPSELALDVPELTVEGDVATDAITGRATPGGLLMLFATYVINWSDMWSFAQGWPVIEPSGQWTADPVPDHDVRPSSQLGARYRVPAGHLVERLRIEPIARVELGGTGVCGFAQPLHPAGATLVRGGATQASGAALARRDGRFYIGLGDRTGRPAAVAPGDSVRMVLAGTPVTVTVPEIAIDVDWEAGTIDGHGPPDTPFLVSIPALRCSPESEDNYSETLTGSSEADGSIHVELDYAGAPGEGIEVAFVTPDGHLVFRQVYRTLGRVYIDRTRVTGATAGLADVTVTLADPDGRPRARGTAAADMEGEFDLRLGALAPGDDAIIHAGDIVTVTAAGDTAAITVKPITFDWSPGEAIVGQAEGDEWVHLELRLRSGRVIDISRTADADGAWRLDPSDVPPRATWAWADVEAVRATVFADEGHEIISESTGFDTRRNAIYLPSVQR
jgi:hypothetical protein